MAWSKFDSFKCITDAVDIGAVDIGLTGLFDQNGRQLKATKHSTISDIAEKASTNEASGTIQGSLLEGGTFAINLSLVLAPGASVEISP